MSYYIEYYYSTGDSFSTSDKTEVLDCIHWENLENAKEALERIKEHYLWYQSKENDIIFWKINEKDRPKKPSWHKIKDHEGLFKNNEHCIINLKLDNGNEIQFFAPWCGYFESLHSATIIVKGADSDTEITF